MYSRREIRLTLAAMLMMFAIMVAGAFGDVVDKYVDAVNGSNGNDGSAATPWKTITYALGQPSVYGATSGSPVELNVAAGTYDTVMGGGDHESFPLLMEDYVSLYGEDPETTIIDAEQADTVIYADGDDFVTIEGFTITNGWERSEKRVNDGAGIHAYNCNGLVISLCMITYNRTENGNGGGIYLKDCCTHNYEPKIHDCCIEHNYAEDGSEGHGGGIYCLNSNADVRNVLLHDNTASDGNGGGLYIRNCSPTITGCDITQNKAKDGSGDGMGGGIYCYNASPTIKECTVSENWADEYGGGIYCTYGSSPSIEDCTIDSNTVRDQGGGGIYLYGGSGTTLTGCMVSGNTAGYNGPGIYANNCHGLVISLCRITGNTTYNGNGGGIYLKDCCTEEQEPKIHDCCIYGNYVENDSDCGDGNYEGYGGGIYCLNSNAHVWNVLLYNNTASNGNGGGFYSTDSTNELFNCLIVGNKATDGHGDGYGGGVYCKSYSVITLTNCTFSLNESKAVDGSNNTGGAIYCQGIVTLLNCILWGDVGLNGGTDELGGGTFIVTYSDVKGGWAGTGNINADPLFCYRGGNTNFDGYFLVQATTPCKSVALGDGDDADRYGTGSANSNTEYSTAVNGLLDRNQVDMGYHYRYGYCTYIELISFEARVESGSVVLTWETGAEIDNAGFMLFRNVADTSDYIRISNLIGAEGGPAYGASYSFVDSGVEPGVAYNYWLVDIDTSGEWTAHGPLSARLPMNLKPIQMPPAFAPSFGGQATTAAIGGR